MRDLIARCVAGEADAWAAFVGRYAGVICAAVKRVAQPRHLTDSTLSLEDLAQEVFVRLLKDDAKLLRAYDPHRASLPTWLTIVARSAAIDRLRRQRPPAHSLDDRFQTAATIDPPRERIRIPAGLLTARQELVLQLLFDRDLSVAEAAALLGVEAQTVRSTQHKAVSRLREHFGEREGAT